MRGNRTVKVGFEIFDGVIKMTTVVQVSAGDLHAFDSPNLNPLVKVKLVAPRIVKECKYRLLWLQCLFQVGIDIVVDRQTVMKPTNQGKLMVHSNLNKNVAILRLVLCSLPFLICSRIFPSITSSTIANFLQPPIQGVVLQVDRNRRRQDHF